MTVSCGIIKMGFPRGEWLLRYKNKILEDVSNRGGEYIIS